MSNNILSFPRGPQYVIPECTYRGSMYHRHSGMGLAGIQENVIPMSVSEEKSNVFSHQPLMTLAESKCSEARSVSGIIPGTQCRGTTRNHQLVFHHQP